MSYRTGIGSRREVYARRRRTERRELLEASQAMLVWNLRKGSGARPRRLTAEWRAAVAC